ncbi:sulfite exporter TauE/SafE family protein [Microvirga sp. VF16]|uniref:sulfite exporter TauE/SafE family protein n=1 Tax=Microvirga sp. VF16 TaxID=2807101 RepID=UPI00193E5416|nr:sulfite exporter TauE/SafE family protein [Microvirga sp. VF16]QRM30516.1 sulfite exporter TauE/SafE family protein [Microvirga sp. VF16]
MGFPDPSLLLVAAFGVFIIAFMKGAFGGGLAIIGIPVLSVVMDPITAGALLAPLFILMDVAALYYWRPKTWSRIDLLLLLPSLACGTAIGFLLMKIIDRSAIAVLIALITLAFTALWFRGGGKVVQQPRSKIKAVLAGTASGITSMMAHSGGPPVAMYLLPLGLPKAVYAGTTSSFFAAGNLMKAVPWLMLAQPTSELWTLMALCLPFIPLGVWAGFQLHERLDQKQLYRVCYGLLIVTSLKLLWDGLRGYGVI